MADELAGMRTRPEQRDIWRSVIADGIQFKRPNSAISMLLDDVASLQRSRDELLAALRMMLSSAHPNERDHPTMFCAWKEARAAIERAEGEQP